MDINSESLSDDQDFDHAVAHAQMMWRQHYKSEVTRRNSQMEFNERTANMAMAASKEQSIRDGIAARNAQTRLDDQLRKERLNEALTHKLKQALLLIAIAIVVYTLIHFA